MIVFLSLAQIINVAIRAEYEVTEVMFDDLMSVLSSELSANAPGPAERQGKSQVCTLTHPQHLTKHKLT